MDKDLIDLFRNILKEELNPIKIQLEENTNILKALEHKVDVLSAEQQNLNMKLLK
jgi:hypothetical protein